MLVSLFLFNFAALKLKSQLAMSVKGTITASDYLPFADYKRLVQSLIDEEKYWWACYCVLAFCTGLRHSDVCRLTWADMLDKKCVILQAQKTGKTHVIPIGKSASERLATLYKKLGRPDKKEFILQSKKSNGKPVSIQYLNRTLKQWKWKYELNIDNFSTHTFRKTFGRYIYEKNNGSEKSLMYLNQIFKHSNLETTRIYLGIRKEEIASIFESLEI